MTQIDVPGQATSDASQLSLSGADRPASMSGHPLLAAWAVSTAIIFCLCAVWAIVTPIGAENDEAAQLVKAASVVRGQIVGTPYSKGMSDLSAGLRTPVALCELYASTAACEQAVTIVTVPKSFTSLSQGTCYGLGPFPAITCPGLYGSGRSVAATTYVGRYPPLYYLLVGWPSLIWHTNSAVYMMRLTSALLSSLLLGLSLAVAAVWSRRRILVLAIVVIATPMVFFFGSAVNPSGLEMAAATCTWTGGLVLVLERSVRPPPSLVAATSAAATAMVLTRGLSPFWLATICAFLVLLAPRSILTLVRDRSVRIAGSVIALASVMAVTYVLWAHALSVNPIGLPVSRNVGTVNLFEKIVGQSSGWMMEFIASIGSFPPPFAVVMAWLIATSAVVLTGLLTGSRRHAWVLVGLVVASVVVPAAIIFSQAHRDSIVWQARDGYPLYAGVVLMAGAIAGQIRRSSDLDRGASLLWTGFVRRLTIFLAVVIPIVQFGSIFWAARRYVVGLGAFVNPLVAIPHRFRWIPPVPVALILAVAAITCITYGLWILKLDARSRVGAGPEPVVAVVE